MAKIFCPNCGSKSEYQFAVPNFCSKCGNPYNSKKNQVNLHSSFSNTDSEEDLANEDSEEFENDNESFFSNSNKVPKISKINFDVDYSSDAIKSIKFEDLINQQSSSSFPKGKKILNE